MDEFENNLKQRDNALNEQMATHPAEESIRILVKDANRRKRQLRLLTISVVFDIVLSLALTYGWQLNHNLAIKAETNRSAILRGCEVSNEARAKNKQLWAYILELPTADGQPRTPEQQKRVDDFRRFINDTFAPRDCSAEINN